MLTPADMEQFEIEVADFKKIEADIDKSMKFNHGKYPWEEASLYQDYPVSVRNKISEMYRDAGWNYVYHRTGSENGEPGGMTRFRFSRTELESQYVKNYHKVC